MGRSGACSIGPFFFEFGGDGLGGHNENPRRCGSIESLQADIAAIAVGPQQSTAVVTAEGLLYTWGARALSALQRGSS